MARTRTTPQDHPAFTALPTQTISLGGQLDMAVHVSGTLSGGSVPLVCLAGHQRNMSDFADFLSHARQGLGPRPVVLLDLPGRGRSSDRQQTEDYSSIMDARDVASAFAALGIGRAVILGQGYGGQVGMVLAAEHPLLIAGTILLDSGPVVDSRGLVRLRNNLAHVEALRGKTVVAGFRRILSGDYPGLGEDRLDQLIGRTHYLDKRGRARPLYDPKLLEALKSINFDDVLAAQWPLYDALACAPLLLLRTQLTDQLRRETFEEMIRRRQDAEALIISGQGSPALLDHGEEVAAIVRFVEAVAARKLRAA